MRTIRMIKIRKKCKTIVSILPSLFWEEVYFLWILELGFICLPEDVLVVEDVVGVVALF